MKKEDKKILEELGIELPKNTAKVWAWVLAFLLIIITAFYLNDKISTQKKYKKAVEQRDSLFMQYNAIVITNKRLDEEYKNLNTEYEQLLHKYNSLIDSAVLKNGTVNQKQKEIIAMQRMLRKQDSILRSIKNIISGAFLNLKSDEMSVEMRNGHIYVTMQNKLLFPSGSAEVEKKGITALRKLAAILNNHPDIDIIVEGHTDNVPIKTDRFRDNWDLSVARATSVVRILTQKYNVASKRVTAAGRGEFYPIASNKTPEGRARNRRTEIILTPNLDELYQIMNNYTYAK